MESFCFTRDLPCPRVSRGVLRLRCFFYLSGVCGTCFFNLPVVAMGSKWSSSLESTRPPNESSRSNLVGSRRVFACSKNTCYLRGRHPCFSHRSHLGHLAPGGLTVEAVLEAFAVCWSFSGFFLDGFWRALTVEALVVSSSNASREMALFLLQNVSGKRADARGGFAMFLIMHLFLLASLSFLNVSELPLLGVTIFVSLYQP